MFFPKPIEKSKIKMQKIDFSPQILQFFNIV